MEKQVNLNLITGIFYSDHYLDVDHDSIVKEVIESREYPNKYPSDYSYRDNYFELGEVHHTFYEDTNLYNHTAKKLMFPIQNLIDNMFGKDMLICDEIWGHLVYPGDQTMVHDHRNNIPVPGLSFAYYPHVLDKGGDIRFITQVNGKRCDVGHKIKKGDIVLFSNDLLHYTPRNGSDQVRVTVSGNFVPTEKFLEILNEDKDGENPYWYYHGKIH